MKLSVELLKSIKTGSSEKDLLTDFIFWNSLSTSPAIQTVFNQEFMYSSSWPTLTQAQSIYFISINFPCFCLVWCVNVCDLLWRVFLMNDWMHIFLCVCIVYCICMCGMHCLFLKIWKYAVKSSLKQHILCYCLENRLFIWFSVSLSLFL